jgi:hypothetical protein
LAKVPQEKIYFFQKWKLKKPLTGNIAFKQGTDNLLISKGIREITPGKFPENRNFRML